MYLIKCQVSVYYSVISSVLHHSEINLECNLIVIVKVLYTFIIIYWQLLEREVMYRPYRDILKNPKDQHTLIAMCIHVLCFGIVLPIYCIFIRSAYGSLTVMRTCFFIFILYCICFCTNHIVQIHMKLPPCKIVSTGDWIERTKFSVQNCYHLFGIVT